jgi:acyl-lipid Delta6-acetylenase / acyl-lipid (9-3)-desaturase
MNLRISGFSFLVLLLSSPHNHVKGFTLPTRGTPSVVKLSSFGNSRLYATIEASPTTKVNGDSSSANPTSWQCDEDAVCVQVPACDEQACRTSLDVRIHGKWYDLSGWRAAHPAGPHWIDWYDGRDATEVMDGFHTVKGREMYKRLPASKPDAVAMLSQMTPPDTTTQLAFRQLRDELEQDGWWERDMTHEALQIGIWASLVVTAGVLAQQTAVAAAQPVACFLLALSMTAAGWLGHDYIHGVDTFAMRIRNFAPVAAGLAPIWWSDKHNKVRNIYEETLERTNQWSSEIGVVVAI